MKNMIQDKGQQETKEMKIQIWNESQKITDSKKKILLLIPLKIYLEKCDITVDVTLTQAGSFVWLKINPADHLYSDFPACVHTIHSIICFHVSSLIDFTSHHLFSVIYLIQGKMCLCARRNKHVGVEKGSIILVHSNIKTKWTDSHRYVQPEGLNAKAPGEWELDDQNAGRC